MEENNYISEMSPKQKMGWKILISIVRKKFPFIKDLLIGSPIYKYDALLGVNIVFDVNDLYKVYNVGPPENYEQYPFLYSTLKDEGSYLMRYVDDQYDDMFGNEFNDKLNQYIELAYSSLPPDMRINQYESFDGPEDELQHKWKVKRETIMIRINKFIPIVNLNKLMGGDL
jgi:hypothetical protein